MENADFEREFGWEDEIENDSPEFTLLPPGDYDFTVTGFERERHPGSAKLPPCNKAVVHIQINAPEGCTTVIHNLFLHSKCEGMLCAFFSGIGQRRHGEKLKMNWNRVVGCRGRCKVGIREWTGRDGETRQSNEIKRFYDNDSSQVENAARPVQNFKAGEF